MPFRHSSPDPKLILQIPAKDAATHFAINIAINANWNLREQIRCLFAIYCEGQRQWQRRADKALSTARFARLWEPTESRKGAFPSYELNAFSCVNITAPDLSMDIYVSSEFNRSDRKDRAARGKQWKPSEQPSSVCRHESGSLVETLVCSTPGV